MLVHICDKCHERVESPIYALGGFRFIVSGVVEYAVANKEFCSLHCQQQYLIDGLKSRNLGNGIKV